LHASHTPTRALQHLRHERGRALLEETGLDAPRLLDPSALWADVEAAFAEHDRRQAAASAAAVDLEFLLQVASAARKLHDVLDMGARSQRQRVCDVLEARLRKGGEASAAACTALQSPEFLLALVAAARAAAHDLKSDRRPESNPSGNQDNLENGWILAEGLPGVFSRHTGLEAELAPANKQLSRPTACMRFLKAAFELSGREVLSDAVVLATVHRWERVQLIADPTGQEASRSAIIPPGRPDDRSIPGQTGQGCNERPQSALSRLFNRGLARPRLGGYGRAG